MAWPTTKATTTSLDDSTDDPNVARVQILQNVNNVNNIIDFIVPSSLATNDVLQWNGSAFVNKTLDQLGVSKTVYLSLLSNSAQGSVNFYRFNELSDPYSLATLSSGKLRLATGTYTVEASLMIDASNHDSNPFFTGPTTYVAATRKSTSGATIGTSLENYMIPIQKFVVANATQDYFIQFDSSSTSDPFSNPTDVVFKITKIS
tara:strand:+ start:689 stop:1300 length:612 start_codon:yes stop_codon:yes gene_type:complete